MKRFIAVMLLLSVNMVYADAASTLQQKLNAIKTMKADFKQQVKAKHKEVSASSGTMALSRPGKFLWKTMEPMEQWVVADGKKMWVYDVMLDQVTVKKQEQGMGSTAALFLSGYNETVAKDFKVTQSTSSGRDVFDLRSSSTKENIQRIKLYFSQNKLTALDLYDQLGQITYVSLVHIQTNPKLSSQLFSFKPPKGVDVVEQ